MVSFEDLRMRLLRPHYIVNALSGILYSLYLYYWADTSAYSIEDEFKLLLGILVLSLFKFRTAPTAEERISAISLNIRLFSLYMAYARKAWISLVLFLASWLASFFLLPLPGYHGYSKLTSLATLEELDAMVAGTRSASTGTSKDSGASSSSRRKDKSKESKTEKSNSNNSNAPALIVMYAAVWAPASRYFETTFAQLSLKYASERLQFAVINVDVSKEVTDKYRINVSSTTLEMPTIVLYRDGQERRRLPSRSEGTAARLAWNRSFDSVVNAFELEDLAYDPNQRPASSSTPQLIG